MEVRTMVLGLYQTNCYLIKEGSDLLVIDPGSSPRRVIEAVRELEGCTLRAVLLTHGHFDHIGAVDVIRNTFGCPVYACQDDEVIMVPGKINALHNLGISVSSEITWLQGNELKIGEFDIRILYTPGHTPGSVMYAMENNLFSGDTLFNESVGRTDLYGGSFSQLKQSLKVVETLPADMVVYPGHESPSTIEHELQYNPFL